MGLEICGAFGIVELWDSSGVILKRWLASALVTWRVVRSVMRCVSWRCEEPGILGAARIAAILGAANLGSGQKDYVLGVLIYKRLDSLYL